VYKYARDSSKVWFRAIVDAINIATKQPIDSGDNAGGFNSS